MSQCIPNLDLAICALLVSLGSLGPPLLTAITLNSYSLPSAKLLTEVLVTLLGTSAA